MAIIRRRNRGGIQKPGASHNSPPNAGAGSGHGDGFQIRGRGGKRGGRGGNNDRGRGRGGRGRGGGHFDSSTTDFQSKKQHQPHHRNGPSNRSNELITIVVKGVSGSDAASETDHGLTKCREWLEQWANRYVNKPADMLKLKSPRWDGDDATYQIEEGQAWKLLKSDGKMFENARVTVQRADAQNGNPRQSKQRAATVSMSADEKTEIYRNFLAKRYDVEKKLLNLSYLGEDQRLNEAGTWDPAATRSRHTDFFPALMRLCESQFPSKTERAQIITSVSLANNELTNMAPVLELAKTFPDLRDLDLSHNKIKDLKDLNLFRYKFRYLDWLVLAPNPIEFEDPEYEHQVLSWYGTLRTLNTSRVRSDQAAASAALVPNSNTGAKLPLTTIKDNFHDEAGIGESAIQDIMMGMDNDRAALARSHYDNESTFSLNYNPSAPRLDGAQVGSWEPYVKQSRNLKKVTQLDQRIRRMAKGISEIESALKVLPPTRHPNLINESLKYSFDCQPIPGVPDPFGQLESGVGGLMVVVNGSFEEFDINTGLKNATRSFTRNFILGPGKGEQRLRVVSDVLTLRADGGYEAFHPELKSMPELPMVTKNFGFPPQTKAEEEIKQAFIAGEISKSTGLTPEWATKLLIDSGWVFQTAMENFKLARHKGLLQNHHFMPEVHAAAVSNPTGVYY